MNRSSATTAWFSILGALAIGLVAPEAAGHVAPPQFPVERPTFEITSWLAIGGGARPTGQKPRGVFDLRLGSDVTVGVGRDGDLRVGPFVEVNSATFASFGAVGGVEVFVGAVPRPLRLFQYSGEGTLAVRFGAGYGWWSDVPEARRAPLASLTVAYGYRCPFSLREPSERSADEPGHRDRARYMIVARLWTNATAGFADEDRVWQITSGIEFEPVGAFRYLLGIY